MKQPILGFSSPLPYVCSFPRSKCNVWFTDCYILVFAQAGVGTSIFQMLLLYTEVPELLGSPISSSWCLFLQTLYVPMDNPFHILRFNLFMDKRGVLRLPKVNCMTTKPQPLRWTGSAVLEAVFSASFSRFCWLHCANPTPESYELTSVLTVSPPVYSSNWRCFPSKTKVFPRGPTLSDVLSFLTVLLNSDLNNTSCSQARCWIGVWVCLPALTHSMGTGTPLFWAEPLADNVNLLLIQEVKKNAAIVGSEHWWRSCHVEEHSLATRRPELTVRVSAAAWQAWVWGSIRSGKMSLEVCAMYQGSRVA